MIGDVLAVGGKVQEERDRLAVELQESEQLRAEAYQACKTMRQELAAVTLERDEWKAGAEYQQEQATRLRPRVDGIGGEFGAGERVEQNAPQQRDELQAQLEAAARHCRQTVAATSSEWHAERDAAREEAPRPAGACRTGRRVTARAGYGKNATP
ncbi:MAG UNVERIFIED_CONTAM: hypothetical protein LVR18_27335 [Planctomycetaceae bacterium]